MTVTECVVRKITYLMVRFVMIATLCFVAVKTKCCREYSAKTYVGVAEATHHWNASSMNLACLRVFTADKYCNFMFN